MEEEMSYGDDYIYIPMTSLKSGTEQEILPDICCYTIQIVNVCMIGQPDHEHWVLVDAGMPYSSEAIIKVAEQRFGVPPKAIILTHGHFDHVGAIIELVKHWNVQVYLHEQEMPYVTGKKQYMPPDPTVDGGLIAKMSSLFPNDPIDISAHVKPLPKDGSIPFLEGWQWIHTPGHTNGHISLFRESDRTLIAGDAFVTVKQESVYKVFMQEQEISGPPKYFTSDWNAARHSVEMLAALKPKVVITGHGQPMSGKELQIGLQNLIDNFDNIALPNS